MVRVNKPEAPARRRVAQRIAANDGSSEQGVQTRLHLLEVAGGVFAEQGYARATSKEICERADVNVAAVNYHFGGKDGLYAAVLGEARARLVNIDIDTQLTRSNASTADKLRQLLRQVVGKIATRDQPRWELQVLCRELMAPTPMMDRMMANQVASKLNIVGAMIGDILGVTPTHPAVSRCMLSIIGPFGFLLITDPDWQKQTFPRLLIDIDTLVDHMVAFTLGGLNAVAADLKRSAQWSKTSRV